MTKKICDKCGVEINGQPWWMLSADHFGQYELKDFEKDFYHFDLCDKCMKDLIALLSRKEK